MLTVLFIIFMTRLEAASLIESRRTSRDLEKAQRTALSEEESRINDLNKELKGHFKTVDGKLDVLLDHFELKGMLEAIEVTREQVSDRVAEAEDTITDEIRSQS